LTKELQPRYAKKAYFYLQRNGKYARKLRFNVVNYQVYDEYDKHSGKFEGRDIALALVVMDDHAWKDSNKDVSNYKFPML
jgi:hypothetical protein